MKFQGDSREFNGHLPRTGLQFPCIGLCPFPWRTGVLEASSSTIERHHLLSAIPKDWETKFKDELAQSPLLKLVAIKVSQQCIEAYRQAIESLLKSGELEARSIRSPYLKIKTTKRYDITVSLNIPEDVRHQRSPFHLHRNRSTHCKMTTFTNTNAIVILVNSGS
jgi:hypothetical protein